MPQYLQQVMGYSAAWAGIAMTASSLATVVMIIVTALASNRAPAWSLIALGLVIEAVGLFHTTLISGDMGFWTIAFDRVWLVAGLPLILVPLTTGAYARLGADATGQASAFLNLFRNIGGAAGISVAQTILARRTPLHLARLAERISPLDPRWRMSAAMAPSHLGLLYRDDAQSSARGLAALLAAVRRQALILAYVDVFWLYAVAAVAALALVPLLWPALRRPALPASLR